MRTHASQSPLPVGTLWALAVAPDAPFMKFAVKFIFYAINVETIIIIAEIVVIVMLLRYRKL